MTAQALRNYASSQASISPSAAEDATRDVWLGAPMGERQHQAAEPSRAIAHSLSSITVADGAACIAVIDSLAHTASLTDGGVNVPSVSPMRGLGASLQRQDGPEQARSQVRSPVRRTVSPTHRSVSPVTASDEALNEITTYLTSKHSIELLGIGKQCGSLAGKCATQTHMHQNCKSTHMSKQT